MAARIEKGGTATATGPTVDVIVLRHDERRLRRKRLVSQNGIEIMLDEPHTVTLRHGTRLVTEEGAVEVIAAEEDLMEVRGRDGVHLTALAWQIGNRHLTAQIEGERILILRDRVIAEMLEGLGASVRDVSEPFEPEGGAYAHSH